MLLNLTIYIVQRAEHSPGAGQHCAWPDRETYIKGVHKLRAQVWLPGELDDRTEQPSK